MIPPPPRQLSSELYWLALRDRWPFLLLGCFITLMAIAMFLPVPFIALLIPKEPDQKKIVAEGRDASAVVSRLETDSNTEINGTHPQRIFFTYTVNGTEKHGKMDTMSVDEVSDWKPGREISIKVLGDEATIPELRPIDFPFWLIGAIFGVVASFFAMLGGIPLFYGLYSAWKKIRVLRWGHLCRVRLLSISERGAAFGPLLSLFGVTRYEASYSALDGLGQPVIGRAATTDLLFVKQAQTGSEIDVLILPGREADSLVLDPATSARLNLSPA